MTGATTDPGGSTDVPELPRARILLFVAALCAVPGWFLWMGLDAGLAGEVPTTSVLLWSGCWLLALAGFAALGAKILSTRLDATGVSTLALPWGRRRMSWSDVESVEIGSGYLNRTLVLSDGEKEVRVHLTVYHGDPASVEGWIAARLREADAPAVAGD